MWLALDTATDRASIAVGGPGGVLARETVVGARRHAAELLPAIERCLAAAELGYGHLEGLVLADGPGSFTGLRVGATVVRALIRVRPIPCWVTPSLLVCAAAEGGSEPVLAVSNALRGDLYAAVYRFRPGAVETLMSPDVLPVAEVLRRAPLPGRVVGPAAATLGGLPGWPDAGCMLGLVGTAGGVRLVAEPASWDPEYGRPAEAQAKWERDHGRNLVHSPGTPR
jgi:tRNA threonylcarbamoyl adenosine modification protein YeaZ